MSSASHQAPENTQFKYLDIITGVFVTVLLISNILSSAKIIDLNTSIAGIPLIFDAGTLVFPISYIFGDILTEVYGYRRSRRVIWMGFFATALTGFFVWLAGQLPGEGLWQTYAGDDAYQAILGGVSGLIVASLVAYFAGEFSNSYVLVKLKIRTNGRFLWVRTIGSTLVGQAVDTSIFIVIAVLLGVFPAEQVIPLIVTNYIFKVALEVILTPLTLHTISSIKQAENVDVYDHNTSFNPFRLTN